VEAPGSFPQPPAESLEKKKIFRKTLIYVVKTYVVAGV